MSMQAAPYDKCIDLQRKIRANGLKPLPVLAAVAESVA
jgi:hypothetical protein